MPPAGTTSLLIHTNPKDVEMEFNKNIILNSSEPG
jgi:hypothetical protein